MALAVGVQGLRDIAAPKPKKVSNMIHARELDINAITTVSDLFELIDLPYRITKHAQLSIVSRSSDPMCTPSPSLRLEWRGDGEGHRPCPPVRQPVRQERPATPARARGTHHTPARTATTTGA